MQEYITPLIEKRNNMKKIISLFVLIVSFHGEVKSQSFGFSLAGTGFVPIYTEQYLSSHTDKTNTTFIPGIRLETNLILPKTDFPGSAFNGFGATFSLPVQDSILVDGWINYGPTVWKGTSTTRYTNFAFRFAYEIYPNFSDFLLLHIGWGMGFETQRANYFLTNYDAAISTIRDPDIKIKGNKIKEHHGEAAPEVIIGAMYELEKFSVFGQYAFRFMFGVSDKMNMKYQNTINIGIYYPLKRF